MQVRHIGIVSNSAQVSLQEVSLVAAAIQKQVSGDFNPIWGIDATISAFASTADIPTGYWPVVILDQLDQPGAGGYHEDSHGQPYALILADDQWPLATSHEILEMLVDPFGQRMASGPSPDTSIYKDTVQFLVEACDPCEGQQFGYEVNGILLSDFYTPNYFDAATSLGTKYSFTGSITAPRQVLAEGYLTWFTPNGGTYQTLVDKTGKSTVKKLELKLKPGQNLREAVDALTHVMQPGGKYIRAKLVSDGHAKAAADRANVWSKGLAGFQVADARTIQKLGPQLKKAEADLKSGASVCSIYKEAKPFVDAALPLIKNLPEGPVIVDAIELLEKIADKLCP